MRRALWVLALAGCSAPSIEVSLRVATGEHPLQGTDRVWLSLADGSGQTRLASDADPSADQLALPGIPAGTSFTLSLQASFAGDTVAAGRSCPFDVTSDAHQPPVPLYFGLVGRFAPTGAPSLARLDGVPFLDGSTPVLAGGATAGGAPLGDSDGYDASTGRFRAGPMLSTPRAGARAVTLPDGTVLLFGGADAAAVAVESIAKGKSTPIPTFFPSTLVDHAAVAFPDGNVLVVGGRLGDAFTNLAFRVSQGGTTVDNIGPLLRTRGRHTATLLGGLGSAAALIAGGTDGTTFVDTLELYTPSAGFQPAGALLIPRADHTATLLENGLVLIAGGVGAQGAVAQAELVDPLQRTSHPSGTLRTPRSGHAATLLPSGRVLITGGTGADGQPLDSVEVFDPSLGAQGDFLAAQPLSQPRTGHSVLPVCDGTLLLVGGGEGAELYTPVP